MSDANPWEVGLEGKWKRGHRALCYTFLTYQGYWANLVCLLPYSIWISSTELLTSLLGQSNELSTIPRQIWIQLWAQPCQYANQRNESMNYCLGTFQDCSHSQPQVSARCNRRDSKDPHTTLSHKIPVIKHLWSSFTPPPSLFLANNWGNMWL